MNWLKRKPLSPDSVRLGDKAVKVRKLTPAKFRELNEATGMIPVFIMHISDALQSDDFNAYMASLVSELFDEVVRIVAVLSDVDAEYIDQNAGIDEIIKYLTKLAEKNDFATAVKNLKRLPQIGK
jgi:hypothetical protein